MNSDPLPFVGVSDAASREPDDGYGTDRLDALDDLLDDDAADADAHSLRQLEPDWEAAEADVLDQHRAVPLDDDRR